MKMILAGVPTSLIPVGPALHDDRDIGGRAGGHVKRPLGDAVLDAFESRKPQPPGGNRESVVAARHEEPIAITAASQRIVVNRRALWGISFTIGSLQI